VTSTVLRIPWPRIAAESAAIVASILLAFAIDAWWDQKTDQRRTHAQLETLRAEFLEVQSQLSSLEDQLLGLREAISDLLQHIGPDTQLQSMDALLILMDLSFRAATFELQSGSLQAFLASGDLSEVPDSELKGMLAAWPAEVSRLRNQSGLLEANREEIIRYLHDKIPTYAIAYKTNQMNDYPKPSFNGRPELLQRDMNVEGLFGNRGMLVEDTLEIVLRLENRASDILELLDVALNE
jgi:hypothetical protein